MGAYFSPYCLPAIAGAIRMWQSVASDCDWRKDAQNHLYRQLWRWYDLLILA